MLILGIDTSTKICSCSLYDTDIGMLAETSLYVQKNHSNIVMPIIDNLFKMTGLKIENVDKIAVAIGPGSFTGVRIALGITKGLAIALNKPLIAINELDILEAIYSKNNFEYIIPLIDARKERVYYKYENNYGDIELIELLKSLNNEKKYVFVGDGAINYKKLIETNVENFEISNKFNSFPRGSILCELAEDKEESNVYTLEPEYISKSRAEKDK